jgi:hypothetical protein
MRVFRRLLLPLAGSLLLLVMAHGMAAAASPTITVSQAPMASPPASPPPRSTGILPAATVATVTTVTVNGPVSPAGTLAWVVDTESSPLGTTPSGTGAFVLATQTGTTLATGQYFAGAPTSISASGFAPGDYTLTATWSGSMSSGSSSGHAKGTIAPGVSVTIVTVGGPAGPNGLLAFSIDTEPQTGQTGPVGGTGSWTLFNPAHQVIATNTYTAGGPRPINVSGMAPGDYQMVATWTGASYWGSSSGQATGTFVAGVTVTTVTVSAPGVGPGGMLKWTIGTGPGAGFAGPIAGTGSWTLYGPGHTPISAGAYNAAAPLVVSATNLPVGAYEIDATWTGASHWLDSSGGATGSFWDSPGSISVGVLDDLNAGQDGAVFEAFTNAAATAPAPVESGVNTCTTSGGGAGIPAACTISGLPPGTYYVRETTPSAYHKVSPTIGSATVVKLATTAIAKPFVSPRESGVVKVTPSSQPGIVGALVTYTATVTATTGTPTGSVQFWRDGVKVGTPIVLAGGQAHLAFRFSAVGSHVVRATYAGSPNTAPGAGTLTEKIAYRIHPLFSQTKAITRGTTLIMKVQILSSSGANKSASSIKVSLRSPALSPAATPQPTGAFAYVASGRYYRFSLATGKLKRHTTYTLSFTVKGDPVRHTVKFVIG